MCLIFLPFFIKGLYIDDLNISGRVCTKDSQTYRLKFGRDDYFTFLYKERIPAFLNRTEGDNIYINDYPINYFGKIKEDENLTIGYVENENNTADLCIFYTNMTNPSMCNIVFVISNPNSSIQLSGDYTNQCYWFTDDLSANLYVSPDGDFHGTFEVYQNGTLQGIYNNKEDISDISFPIYDTFVIFKNSGSVNPLFFVERYVYNNIAENLSFVIEDFEDFSKMDYHHSNDTRVYHINSSFQKFKINVESVTDISIDRSQTSLILLNNDDDNTHKSQYYADSCQLDSFSVPLSEDDDGYSISTNDIYTFSWFNDCYNKQFIKDYYFAYNVNNYFTFNISDNSTCVAIYSSIETNVTINSNYNVDVISDGSVYGDNKTIQGHCTVIKFTDQDNVTISLKGDTSGVNMQNYLRRKYLSTDGGYIYDSSSTCSDTSNTLNISHNISINESNVGIIKVPFSAGSITRITSQGLFGFRFQPNIGGFNISLNCEEISYDGDLGDVVFALDSGDILDLSGNESVSNETYLFTVPYTYGMSFSTGRDLFFVQDEKSSAIDFNTNTSIWYCLAVGDNLSAGVSISLYYTPGADVSIERYDNEEGDVYLNFVVHIGYGGTCGLSFGTSIESASEFVSVNLLSLSGLETNIKIVDKLRYVINKADIEGGKYITFKKKVSDQVMVVFTSNCLVTPSECNTRISVFIDNTQSSSIGPSSNKYAALSRGRYILCDRNADSLSLYLLYPDFTECTGIMYATGAGSFNMILDSTHTICGIYGGKIKSLYIRSTSKTSIDIGDGNKTGNYSILIGNITENSLHSMVIDTNDNFISVRAEGDPLYIGYDILDDGYLFEEDTDEDEQPDEDTDSTDSETGSSSELALKIPLYVATSVITICIIVVSVFYILKRHNNRRSVVISEYRQHNA